MRVWQADIGAGWRATLSRGLTGRETLSIVHPETMRGTVLDHVSVQRLREIFAEMGKSNKP